MKKLIVAIFLVSLFLPTVCLAADARVVNHVMANKIEFVQGKGFQVIGPIIPAFVTPAGETGNKLIFSTFDQLIFEAGTYKVEQKIIDEATGQLVVAQKPRSITVKKTPDIFQFINAWEFASKVGSFTYQIVVDDRVIGAFRISVLAGK